VRVTHLQAHLQLLCKDARLRGGELRERLVQHHVALRELGADLVGEPAGARLRQRLEQALHLARLPHGQVALARADDDGAQRGVSAGVVRHGGDVCRREPLGPRTPDSGPVR
jgi:hypothetical protein